MLALTETATIVIQSLVDDSELPDSAGLRIATTDDGAQGLRVEAAATPERGDQVVEERGARVFLEPRAATMLDDRVLDATVDTEGHVEFVLAAQ